ncbi:MAG: [FeFe] hydrogenase H-cluster radical SAM maturase HydG [Nitrospirota bacterium]
MTDQPASVEGKDSPHPACGLPSPTGGEGNMGEAILRDVEGALGGISAPSRAEIDDILCRAGELKGLPLSDAAKLLMVEDEDALRAIYEKAAEVKSAVFGPRVVLFAPLYLSNYCSNDCLYCGFRKSNSSARRKALSPDEAVEQAKILSRKGFKRIILVAGEHPLYSGVDYLIKIAGEIYSRTDVRILHVNSAPLPVEDFRRLKSAGYGVYQCFQETYHRESYKILHPTGKKSDFQFRLSVMDRALQAGFGDVGIGPLLGLYDYRYDALAAIAHSKHLEARFGACAHTISVPRLKSAEGAEIKKAPYPVSDEEFKKIVAVYRLSVPQAGVVVSTRESARLREECLSYGASQISAGSSTEPGGYDGREKSTSQFDLSDIRPLSEMARVIAEAGLLPSLCTACYRSGRQGNNYLHVASSGKLKELCTANALLSLKEYLLDAQPEGREVIEAALNNFIGELKGALREDVVKKMEMIVKGDRDIHY